MNPPISGFAGLFRERLVSVCGRLDRMTRLFCCSENTFAAFATLQFFGSYRTNNGHHGTLSRRG